MLGIYGQKAPGRNRLKKSSQYFIFSVYQEMGYESDYVLQIVQPVIDAKDELSTSNSAKSINLTYHESFLMSMRQNGQE